MIAVYGPYTYKLTFCDEFTEYKPKSVQGLLFANTYAEAIEKLTNYYGDENIISIDSLIAYEENELLEIKDEYDFNTLVENLS
jgi:hypothetical protein